MYLTEIKHDFNFNLNIPKSEILHSLEFKKIKRSPLFLLFKSKISFYNTQGRNLTLLWKDSLFSSIRNYIFVVDDIIEFYWESGSSVIKYKCLKYANSTLVQYWLLHTLLPLYYLLENIYEMLHVGAIEINEKACLFAAPSFGGKSTLTHYFARNYRALEDLGKYIKHFSQKSLPVTSIYKLRKVGAEEEIIIQKVKGMNKFSILEMSYDMKLSVLKEKEFANLHDLVQNLAVYIINIPQSLDRLNDVYESIVEHFMYHS